LTGERETKEELVPDADAWEFWLAQANKERDDAYAATDVWVKRVEEVEGALHRARSLLRRAVGAGIDDQWLKDARKALQAKP
jgi:hypothetical protein